MKNLVNRRLGWLALIGGGEDKEHDCAVLRRIVSLNQAQQVAIIPAASRVGEEVGQEYDRVFAALGVPGRSVLDIRDPGQAGDVAMLAAVDRADLIFFTGGDQVRLVDLLQGTPLLDRVRLRLQAGATVAGTSAGAAAAGRRMLFDGDGRGFTKGAIGSGAGFGFVDNLAIDTHFLSRGRLARLTQFLSQHEADGAFGLSEDTAVLISPANIATVIGSDMVTALHLRQVEHSDYHQIDHGERFTVDGVRLSFLAPGTMFDLQRWRCLKPVKPALPALRAGKTTNALV